METTVVNELGVNVQIQLQKAAIMENQMEQKNENDMEALVPFKGVMANKWKLQY